MNGGNQKDGFLMTILLLFCKWPVFLPFIAVFSYWALRKRSSGLTKVENFFNGFRVGGHRGSPTKQPENTIASMEQAKREGADLIEFDVSLTRDGIAVILHDDTLERTTNMNGAIRDVPFGQLKACNCAAKFQTPEMNFDTSTFMAMPTLEELVKWAKANNMKMLFDVKDSDQCRRVIRHQHQILIQLVAKLEELFQEHQLYDTGLTWRRWFCSYADLYCQIRRHKSAVKHVLALIFDVLYICSLKTWLPAFLGVDMMLTDRLEISENYVREQERAGRKVCAWTVNDENEMIWMSKTLKIPFLTDKPFLAASVGATSHQHQQSAQ